MDKNTEQKLLNIEDLSGFLNVPKSWVYRRTYKGCNEDKRIPFLKIGKYIRFNFGDIIDWLENMKRYPKSRENRRNLS